LAELRGCPLPDRDKDGLLDKDDACPDVAGPIENKGCPYNDQDNDGIPDKDDRCPTLKGVPENNGCPAIKEEVQAKLR
ncbi:MAG: thrombospondin type 3 repeat-containing protein, partial [Flavobacteriales bacterium]|nr:thrombospondin type 3 repeat-containing protein [Flavobacteriales bacterium]MDW8410896.1 thrombospondin type 3 repeat-containing protein [Flavobacteriales bacterium]